MQIKSIEKPLITQISKEKKHQKVLSISKVFNLNQKPIMTNGNINIKSTNLNTLENKNINQIVASLQSSSSKKNIHSIKKSNEFKIINTLQNSNNISSNSSSRFKVFNLIDNKKRKKEIKNIKTFRFLSFSNSPREERNQTDCRSHSNKRSKFSERIFITRKEMFNNFYYGGLGNGNSNDNIKIVNNNFDFDLNSNRQKKSKVNYKNKISNIRKSNLCFLKKNIMNMVFNKESKKENCNINNNNNQKNNNLCELTTNQKDKSKSKTKTNLIGITNTINSRRYTINDNSNLTRKMKKLFTMYSQTERHSNKNMINVNRHHHEIQTYTLHNDISKNNIKQKRICFTINTQSNLNNNNSIKNLIPKKDNSKESSSTRINNLLTFQNSSREVVHKSKSKSNSKISGTNGGGKLKLSLHTLITQNNQHMSTNNINISNYNNSSLMTNLKASIIRTTNYNCTNGNIDKAKNNKLNTYSSKNTNNKISNKYDSKNKSIKVLEKKTNSASNIKRKLENLRILETGSENIDKRKINRQYSYKFKRQNELNIITSNANVNTNANVNRKTYAINSSPNNCHVNINNYKNIHNLNINTNLNGSNTVSSNSKTNSNTKSINSTNDIYKQKLIKNSLSSINFGTVENCNNMTESILIKLKSNWGHPSLIGLGKINLYTKEKSQIKIIKFNITKEGINKSGSINNLLYNNNSSKNYFNSAVQKSNNLNNINTNNEVSDSITSIPYIKNQVVIIEVLYVNINPLNEIFISNYQGSNKSIAVKEILITTNKGKLIYTEKFLKEGIIHIEKSIYGSYFKPVKKIKESNSTSNNINYSNNINSNLNLKSNPNILNKNSNYRVQLNINSNINSKLPIYNKYSNLCKLSNNSNNTKSNSNIFNKNTSATNTNNTSNKATTNTNSNINLKLSNFNNTVKQNTFNTSRELFRVSSIDTLRKRSKQSLSPNTESNVNLNNMNYFNSKNTYKKEKMHTLIDNINTKNRNINGLSSKGKIIKGKISSNNDDAFFKSQKMAKSRTLTCIYPNAGSILCNKIKIILLSNHGDLNDSIGLTGLELYNDDKIFQIENARTIGALPKDLKSYYKLKNENRIFENIFNNINKTNDESHMWLTYIDSKNKKRNDPYIEITFDYLISLTKIRFYNYNEKNSLNKGVKHARIILYQDDTVLKDNIYFLYMAIGEKNLDYSQDITYPFDQLKMYNYDYVIRKYNSSIQNNYFKKYVMKKRQFEYDYVCPYIPFGFVIKIELINNHGDSNYIGFEKIEFFDIYGKEIILNEENDSDNFSSNSNSNKELQNNNILTCRKLYIPDRLMVDNDDNNCNSNCFFRYINMKKNVDICEGNRIYFIFNMPVFIHHINIYKIKKCDNNDISQSFNENENRIYYSVVNEYTNANDIKIFVDGNIVFEGKISINDLNRPLIIYFGDDNE